MLGTDGNGPAGLWLTELMRLGVGTLLGMVSKDNRETASVCMCAHVA